MSLKTRFTERFDVDFPIVLAPMDLIAGGKLAAAVSAAGGLGLIGGGYGNADWVEQAFLEAGKQPVGIGFITWSVQQDLSIVEKALANKPSALMVSFGDAEDVIEIAKAAGIPTIWQIQRFEQAVQAHQANVDVIVVQGQEAGGHGMDRGLVSLVPAVRDLVGADGIVLAAGGIADGRGLAASLMLGADGVMLGTRFWASREASGSDAAKARLVETGGDQTVRSKVFDVLRGVDWPWQYTGRIVENDVSRRWHGDMTALIDQADAEREKYNASAIDDFSTRVLIAGEALDLVSAVEPAGEIVHRIGSEAEIILNGASRFLGQQSDQQERPSRGVQS